MPLKLPPETKYRTNSKSKVWNHAHFQIFKHQIWFYEKPTFPPAEQNYWWHNCFTANEGHEMWPASNQSHDVCDEPSHTCRVQFCVWSKEWIKCYVVMSDLASPLNGTIMCLLNNLNWKKTPCCYRIVVPISSVKCATVVARLCCIVLILPYTRKTSVWPDMQNIE